MPDREPPGIGFAPPVERPLSDSGLNIPAHEVFPPALRESSPDRGVGLSEALANLKALQEATGGSDPDIEALIGKEQTQNKKPNFISKIVSRIIGRVKSFFAKFFQKKPKIG